MIAVALNETCMPAIASESPYHAPEVRLWVEAARTGDQAAFARLVERFQRDVYGKVFSILRSHLNADDVVQETFLRVYRALPGFRFECSFRTWLITIATRQALNFLGRPRPESLDALEGGEEPAALRSEDGPLDHVLELESRHLLREAMPGLPPRQRQALTLKLQNDWSYEEIAREMGISVGSVKTNIFHAVQHLARRLKGATP